MGESEFRDAGFGLVFGVVLVTVMCFFGGNYEISEGFGALTIGVGLLGVGYKIAEWADVENDTDIE
jgi:hypothetical protein